MDINDPVTVFTLHDPMRAEVIKNFLKSEGIRCRLDGANAGTTLGLNFNEIGVVVQASDAERARGLIDTHEAHKGKDRPDGGPDHLDD